MATDTSVWIDYFNGVRNAESDALDAALIDGTAAIGDLIRLEILQGFRRERDFRQAQTVLDTLDQYELLGHRLANRCADNYRALRRRGITVSRTADLIIATFCIEHQMPLLFSDRDFAPFVARLGLRSAS